MVLLNFSTMPYLDNCKVSKGAKIRNRYNQVPHLTQDTNGKVTNSQKTPQTRAKYQMSRISKGCSLFSNVMSLLRKYHIIPNTAF